MKKSLNDLLSSLSQRDLNTLKSIYSFRCLTSEQIYQLHFQEVTPFEKSLSQEYAHNRISEMLNMDLIKEVEFKGGESSYFLTPSGIEAIRFFFELPTNVYDAKKKVVKRGYYRASELDMYPKHINHQVKLNQFVIDFQLKDFDTNWKYFDEKYVSHYTHIRPDGLLSLLDTDFFLEMDMATESKKQLFEKWENYRNFLMSREYAYREKKIIVLFIVDGTTKIQQRIDLIKYTIYERLLDVIDSEFDIYVGTSDQLLTMLQKRLLPAWKDEDPYSVKVKNVLENKHGFYVTEGEKIKSKFNDTKFGFYIRKINEKGTILIENNRIQEFVVDDYFFESPTIMSKIAYHDKNITFFKEELGREISYLVIARTEEQPYHDLKMVDLLGLPNIFFSTFKRLKERPFHEAIFQYDLLGNLHHFTDSGLQERIFEQSFSEDVVKR